MASFGENLRRERELRGITLNELANSTKVGVRHLEALERNQFHRLPGGIFNRGFVRAVARYMKLDEAFWISEYARAAGEEPEVLAHYAPETTSRPAASGGHLRSAWSFVALLVLFAVGAYVVHDLRMRRAAEAAQAAQPAPHLNAPRDDHAGAQQAGRLGAGPAALNALDSSSTPPTPQPQPALAQPNPPSAEPAAPEAAADAEAAPADLRLQIDVVEEAWVRVAVDDQVRFQGQVKPGEPRRFRAGRRLEVSTRNASAVVLTLNGETLPPLGQPGEERTVVLTSQDLKPSPR